MENVIFWLSALKGPLIGNKLIVIIIVIVLMASIFIFAIF